jgi:hypothetical protein
MPSDNIEPSIGINIRQENRSMATLTGCQHVSRKRTIGLLQEKHESLRLVIAA